MIDRQLHIDLRDIHISDNPVPRYIEDTVIFIFQLIVLRIRQTQLSQMLVIGFRGCKKALIIRVIQLCNYLIVLCDCARIGDCGLCDKGGG